MSLRALSTWFACAAMAAAALFWAFSAPPVAVDFGVVDRGDVAITVTEDGVARIREVFTISAPSAGRMLRPPLDVGDRVERNETILTVIEPQPLGFLDARQRSEAQAAVRAATAALRLSEADLVRAEAELRYWSTELSRNERLLARDAIAERTLEQTRMEREIREAALAQAKAGLSVRREELARVEAMLIEPEAETTGRADCCINVLSPISGRVLDVIAESAQVVATGAPLLSVGDPGDIEIIVDLLSADAVRIQPGARAFIRRWGGDAALEARVARIEPVAYEKVSALGVDEQRVDAHLDLVAPADRLRRLGHLYRVVAEIEIDRRADVLRAPIAALFRDGDEWRVFAEEDGVAALRPIAIGVRNDEVAEVLDGLDEGARVVLYPSDRIVDGSRLIPRD